MDVLNVAETTKGGISTFFDVLSLDKNINHHFLAYDFGASENLRMSNKRMIRVFYLYLSLISEIVKGKSDVIFLHSTFAGLLRLLIFPIAVLFQKKVVYCSHGWSFDRIDYSRKMRFIFVIIERVSAYFCHRVYCISKADYDSAIKYGIARNKVELIWNGVRSSMISIDDKKINTSDQVNVLYVGRLDRQKGVDIFIESLERIDSDLNKKVTVNIVGNSVLGDFDFDKVNIDGFKNIDIHKLGWVSSNEIDHLYLNSDFLVIPSLWEGFGLTAIESLRNGTPVLASNVGSLPYIINENVGWVFSSNDIEHLSDNILDIINSSRYLDVKPETCYEWYKKNFTADLMNNSYFSSLSSL